MKKTSIYFIMYFCSLVTLHGQIEQQNFPGLKEINNKRAPFNLEELKVRWKKAALESCVPCPTFTVPGAPTSVSATAGNAQSSVSFTVPSSNGGSVITGYTVTSNPGNITVTGSSSPITVGGLTNGISYTFTVVATNAVGNSAASAASVAVTPAPIVTVPSAPTGVSATAGDAQASVSFTVPSSTGGSAITGYTVTSSPGSFTGTGTVSPIIITGLTNGTPYTFTVVATNAAGNSAASAASVAVTPAPIVTVPSAPTGVSATAGDAQASVSFTVPSSTGGSAITGYTVTSSPGSFTGTGTVSPIIVTGLINGTPYTFTIVATNVVGNSSASSVSSVVTPATVPSAPTSVTATAGNAQATVSFTVPSSNGGSVITGYTVTSNPGNITVTGSSSPITVSGLTNGISYTFTVLATNAIGNSAASTVSTAVTPAFNCGTSTITDVDGNTYNTVSIGTQCWTASNLKVTKYNDGTPIPDQTTSSSWGSLTTGARTDYDLNTAASGAVPSGQTYVSTYGYLYNWFAAAGIITAYGSPTKNICPSGWHVPTDAEWTTLTNFLGESVAGNQMKTTGTTLWNSAHAGDTNSSGFSALPGGTRLQDGSFSNITNSAFFWSATVGDTFNYAWYRLLDSGSSGVQKNEDDKSVGASVRCLRG